MRNARAYAGTTQRRIVSAWISTAFARDDVTRLTDAILHEQNNEWASAQGARAYSAHDT